MTTKEFALLILMKVLNLYHEVSDVEKYSISWNNFNNFHTVLQKDKTH